jgi:hypothetical protein
LVLPRLVAENSGVLGMKPFAFGAIIDQGVATPQECLRYPMSLPTSVVITGCDNERSALVTRTAPAGVDGRFEAFNTTTRFDGTTQHPKWMETANLSPIRRSRASCAASRWP